MRVLLLTWACDLEDVSEPAVSANWVREISRDHEVTVFSVSKPERFGCVRQQFPELEVIEWSDMRVPRFLERFRAIVKPGYLLYYFRARRFLRRLIRERHFDVIHHLSPFAWRYPSPAVGLGIPLVRGPVAGGLKTPGGLRASSNSGFHPFMFLRGADDLRMRFDPVLRSTYVQADHVLMAAPYVQELLSAFPITSSSIEIEHGLSSLPEPAQNPSMHGSGDEIEFLYVGRVVPTKGLRYAIQAVSMSSQRDSIKLKVIGDGADLAECMATAERLGIQNRVQFLGWLPKAEVNQHYRQADVFLFPSFREPTGGVLLEALSYGLPCITCSYGGTDYLVDDLCGLKVFPASEKDFVADLAAAIDRLAMDEELRNRMSANARKRAIDYFGWEAKRRRIGKLYAELAGVKE